MNKKTFDINFNWKSKKSIPIYLLMIYFLFLLFIYLKQDFLRELQQPSTLIITILWVVVSLISILEVKPIRSFYHNYGKWIEGILLLLSPIASFLIVEIMVGNLNPGMFRNYSLYNLVWYFAITFLIYAVIRDCQITIIASDFLIYLAAMVNYLVYLFRGNPILPSDLLAWQTGMSVASNYELSFTREFLIATLLMLVTYVMAMKLEKSDKKRSAFNRFVGAGVYTLLIMTLFYMFFNTDLIEKKIQVLDFFAPKYTYCTYGTAFGFVANVKAMDTKAPEGYSAERVKEILGKTNVAQTEASEEKPNLIVIMNEAFSDLNMVGEYATNINCLPYSSTLEENTTKGILFVSVFGGATSDTEYEFLTGNSMAVMPGNCVPYQQFITEPTASLASNLKKQGYYNIAIHPYEPSGYKRDLVYPLLGFDEFLSKEDFTNPQIIRSYISDRESYKKIIEQYEKKGKDNPLFIFNVTMQNHGGYNEEQIFEEEETVRLTDRKGCESVEQYLSLLRESDKALETLMDYFSKEEEHTIVLLFGDHQPVAYSEFQNELAKQSNLDASELYRRKYSVPFLLWANYDITEDDVDQISANYLSSYLLKTAELDKTAYNDYLLGLSKEVPVITSSFYIDKNKAFHQINELSEYSSLISDYLSVGYNNALDNKNKLNEFFYLD